MDKYRKWGLWLRIALPFLLFVVAGSIILCAWLYGSASRGSMKLFATLARTNADFIRSSQLPASERMATELSRILDLQVCFREAGGGHRSAARREHGAVRRKPSSLRQSLTSSPWAGHAHWRTATTRSRRPLIKSHDLLLIRPAQDTTLLLRPPTLIMLAAFWGLSLVLAWTLTQGVVRPLRILALRLPHIEKDDAPVLPGTERNDEIGLLARTYLNTHNQLVAERARREKAERLALLGKMATGLAHEINNPLSSIRMHVQLMESANPSELPAAAADTIPTILGETSKIESLVNQWMFLARPAPPQVSPKSILGELVRWRGEIDAAAGAPCARSYHYEHRYSRCSLRVNADARRVRQAVGNIIVNAIQAMPTVAGHTANHRARVDPGRSDGTDKPRLSRTPAAAAFSRQRRSLHYADLFLFREGGRHGHRAECHFRNHESTRRHDRRRQ